MPQQSVWGVLGLAVALGLLPALVVKLALVLPPVIARARARRAVYSLRYPWDETGWLPPIERISADLHRLSITMDQTATAYRLPGRIERMQAASLAYDETLRLACRAVGAPEPDHAPLGSLERLETEASLAQQGMRW